MVIRTTAWAIAMLAAAIGSLAGGASVRAQSWSPQNTDFTFWSDDPRFGYAGATVECDESELSGNTQAGVPIVEELWFGPPPHSQNCSSSTAGATVTDIAVTITSPGWSFPAVQATGGGDGVAELEIPDGDGIAVVVATLFGTCEYRVDGPQAIAADLVNDSPDLLLFGEDRLAPDTGNVAVTRSGSSLCGPASGAGTLSATYERTSPDGVEIDP